jgi:hypothetical protein
MKESEARIEQSRSAGEASTGGTSVDFSAGSIILAFRR